MHVATHPPLATDQGADARSLLVRLCTAGAFAYCSYAMCRSPVLPLFARHLGASAPLVGFVSAASTITGIVVKLPAGALSDVWGRRPLLIAGAVAFALMPFTYVGIWSLTALVLLRFVHGNATAIFGPVSAATLSDLAPPERRGAWLGTYATVQGVAQAIGPVAAGALIAGGLFWPAFAMSGVIELVALAVVLTWPPAPPATVSLHGGRWTALRHGVAEVASDPRILTTSLAQASQFFVNGTMTAFLPLYASEVVHVDAWRIGIVIGTQTLTTLCARPLFGILSDRLGRRPLIIAGLASCGLATLLTSFATTGLTLTLVVMAYGAGVAVTTSSTSAFVTDVTRRARYGAAHGVFGTIYDVGDASGPIVAGLLVAGLGYAGMFRVMGVVCLGAALLFAVVSRQWHTAAD